MRALTHTLTHMKTPSQTARHTRTHTKSFSCPHTLTHQFSGVLDTQKLAQAWTHTHTPMHIHALDTQTCTHSCEIRVHGQTYKREVKRAEL